MARSRRRTHRRFNSDLPRLSEHSEIEWDLSDEETDGHVERDEVFGTGDEEGGCCSRALEGGAEKGSTAALVDGSCCSNLAGGTHSAIPSVDEDVVRRKVDLQLLPLFFLIAMLCYLDRSNLNFASIPLSKQLGFSDLVYGFGAGVFAIGYALFQIPSNLVLAHVGARKWLAVLMVVWGVVACAMAGIQSATSFHILRFLLGIAECGTFPGMWYHLSLFYTAADLGPAYAIVTSATALASVLGGFLAAGLLCMNGVGGLHGWQWLFLAEGLPTICLAAYVWFALPDSPATASFLNEVERQFWQDKLSKARSIQEDNMSKPMLRFGVAKLHRNFTGLCGWRVWYIGMVWFLVECSLYGILFWSNKLIKSFVNFGQSSSEAELQGSTSFCLAGASVKASLLSVIPFGLAAATMLWIAVRSKARNERRFHTAVPVFVASMAMMMMPALEMIASGYLSFIAMAVAASGVWAVHGPLLSWPATFLSGSDAAGGYALINSLGSLGGFVGPILIGVMGQLNNGTYEEAIYVLSAGLLLAAFLAIVFPQQRKRTTDAAYSDDAQENDIIRSAELVSFLRPQTSPTE